MSRRLTIGIAQLNLTVGNIQRNLEKIKRAWLEGREHDVDVIVGSELGISGYPLEDLVLKPFFQERLEQELWAFSQELDPQGPSILIGAPWRIEGALYNTALWIRSGKVAVAQRKTILPNYGVFDEKRWFMTDKALPPITIADAALGVLICEDMWIPDPIRSLVEQGAEMAIVVNGSPFDQTKHTTRLALARERVKETALPLIYVNQVGGQDELIFDGGSFALQADGALTAQACWFQEDFIPIRWRHRDGVWRAQESRIERPPSESSVIYQGLVVALRDYIEKNRFPGVLIGLSGGIDSALSALIAVDALGSERVDLVMMPSPYTSPQSLEDAETFAEKLSCRYRLLPIDQTMIAFDRVLLPFLQAWDDIPYQNLQSRIRGVLLMALSNSLGSMVVATGNKSELAVGYATLYGDLCGGYAPLKDVYKTQVYQLARWRNGHRPPQALGPETASIPSRIIDRPPSAELKPEQTDQETLPPYPILDDILKGLIEEDLSLEDLRLRGHDQETVMTVWSWLDRAEYKRRQAPPGVKVTTCSFGKERRYPITNDFFTYFKRTSHL